MSDIQQTPPAYMAIRPQLGISPADDDDYYRKVLDDLPAAIYTTDASGHITYYNEAAVNLWGHRPEIGKSEWCGSWKLYWPDGRGLPHGECPMAVAIKEKKKIRGMEAVAERPDGSRVPFIPYPTPLFDADGELIGAVNMLVDISERKKAEEAAQRLAAIVESSDDAILTKSLDGIIATWNKGAERIFGYKADEIVGKSILTLNTGRVA
jgi:PAS domain S-box-containing protein